MIIRLSQKLAKKLKVGPLRAMPSEENPYADWSANLFTADRTQYIILTNTQSLYSVVMYAKGITDESRFIGRALDNIREFMESDGQAFVYQRFIAPASSSVKFGKALNRSVTGSMNDLIKFAKHGLIERELSPYDVGFNLNEIPMSALGYQQPREVLKTLAGGSEDDTFVWRSGDDGTAGDPAIDIIVDFVDELGGDVLDLSDLLVGEESNPLTDYLNFQYIGRYGY